MSDVGKAGADASVVETVVETEAEKVEVKEEGAETEGDADEGTEGEKPEAKEGEPEGDTDSEGKPTKSKLRRERQKAHIAALEADNKRLVEQVAAIERGKPVLDTLGPKPERSKYEDETEYTADLAAWKTEERLLARQQSAYKTNSTAARTEESENRKKLFHERAMAIKETYPDIESIFSQQKLPITGGMAEAIMESPKGPELAYHLANNPTDFQRIQAMTPGAALMELGRLEAKLSLPKTRTETKAPPPPSTLTGSSAVVTRKTTDSSGDALPADVWVKQENERVRKRKA